MTGSACRAIPYQKIDPQFLRQVVADPTGARPGTVVVDTSSHHLYLVREGGMAIRYGVGLGRDGFEWSGDAVIQWKQHWPKWTPPDEMVARDPKLEPYSAANGGMPGGLTNPLGARALYLFHNGAGHAVPPARLAGVELDRQVGIVRLRAADQPGHHRSLRPRAQPDAGDRHLGGRRRLFGRPLFRRARRWRRARSARARSRLAAGSAPRQATENTAHQRAAELRARPSEPPT